MTNGYKTMPIKLTNEIETSIVTAYQQGARTEDIQARFGITRASIYNVLKRNNLKPDRAGKPRQKLPISQKGLKRLADWWQEHKEQEHKEQEHKEQEHKEQEHKEQEHKEQEHKEQEHKEQEHKEHKEHKEQEHKEQEHKEQEHTVYHRLGIIAYRHLKGE